MNQSKHQTYIDIIRVLAAFMVIFTHTADLGSKLYVTCDYGMLRNAIYISADILRTVNVPLFFMVSGALLLGKNESYQTLYRKRILRFLIVLIAVSYLYFTASQENAWYDIGTFMRKLWSEAYIAGHFWYMYAYIGYLMMLPLLRKMVMKMEDKDFQYLLIMGILFERNKAHLKTSSKTCVCSVFLQNSRMLQLSSRQGLLSTRELCERNLISNDWRWENNKKIDIFK